MGGEICRDLLLGAAHFLTWIPCWSILHQGMEHFPGYFENFPFYKMSWAQTKSFFTKNFENWKFFSMIQNGPIRKVKKGEIVVIRVILHEMLLFPIGLIPYRS